MVIKSNNVFGSKLLSKCINTLIYLNLKKKIETFIYKAFFLWKKLLNTNPIFNFFETILKIRPLVGFYLYIVKKKRKKQIKIKPYFMHFTKRWQKSIYWFGRALKVELGKFSFIATFLNEIHNTTFYNKSNSLKQKTKYYKTILLFKSSKNFKW